MICAFALGEPPRSSSTVQSDRPYSVGSSSYGVNLPSRISQTLFLPMRLASSMPLPQTTMPRVTPRLESTCAIGMTRFSSYTPSSCMVARAGLDSGPSTLKMVRSPMPLRTGATFFMDL